MTTRYREIIFDSHIYQRGVGSENGDSLIASDGWLIVRSADGHDVCLHHKDVGQFHVPWARVRKAVPAEPVSFEEDVPPGDEEDDDVLAAEPLLAPPRKRSGWPKGKPRKPKPEATNG